MRRFSRFGFLVCVLAMGTACGGGGGGLDTGTTPDPGSPVDPGPATDPGPGDPGAPRDLDPGQPEDPGMPQDPGQPKDPGPADESGADGDVLAPECAGDVDCLTLHGPPGVCKAWKCLDKACLELDADGLNCDDGDSCTKDDLCQSGVCDGTPYSCPDGLDCTGDECQGDGGCLNPLHDDWCLIGGDCFEDGDFDPANPCGVCDAAKDPVDWTDVPDDTDCDDGKPATTGDHCAGGLCLGEDCTCTGISACCDGCLPVNEGGECDDGDSCTKDDQCVAGFCVGTAYSCVDGPDCTDDVCGGDGSCDNPLQTGWCLIEGECFEDGDFDPTEGCRVCDAAKTALAWTPLPDQSPCDDGDPGTGGDQCLEVTCTGTPCNCQGENDCCGGCLALNESGPCDDGEACTKDDQCTAGTCVGTSYVCLPDAIQCTDDLCDGDGGCDHPFKPTWCYIASTCFPNSSVNPADNCEWCSPSTSTTQWSPKPEGFICNDGDPCTYGDTCQGGVCVAGPDVCNPPTLWSDVQPIFGAKCVTCHQSPTPCSSGDCLADTWLDTQKTASSCSGKKIYECMLTRIQSGSMPSGKGCTGDPTQDAGNGFCLTLVELDLVTDWVGDGGLKVWP